MLLVYALRAMAVVMRAVQLRCHLRPQKNRYRATTILTSCSGTVPSLVVEHRPNLIAKSTRITSLHHQNTAGVKRDVLTKHRTLPLEMIDHIDLESNNRKNTILLDLHLISPLVVIRTSIQAQGNQQVTRQFPMMGCRAHGG